MVTLQWACQTRSKSQQKRQRQLVKGHSQHFCDVSNVSISRHNRATSLLAHTRYTAVAARRETLPHDRKSIAKVRKHAFPPAGLAGDNTFATSLLQSRTAGF